jgi:integrase
MQPSQIPPVALPVTAQPEISDLRLLIQGLAEAAQAILKTCHALSGGSFTENAPVAAASAGNGVARSSAVHPFDTRTVREAINEFLIVKARAKVSDRYLRTLHVSLSSFAQGRAHALLQDVTAEDIEKWVYGKNWRPKTMKGYLGDVRTLFHFCQRRGYVTECPPDAVEIPGSDTRGFAPAIHTPEEARTVLECLRRVDLDVMRHVAIRYFAGVRSAEAHRLTEADLKLDQGLIEIPALKAKTRARRLITIQPNLAAWLALGGELRNLCPENVRQKIRLSGVEWKHNATRHSFVSYHYAAFGDAKLTAREAGHTEEMLFANYRALVTKELGLAYFMIVPR